MSETTGDPAPRYLERPTLFTAVFRAMRLRCPRCGHGRLFSGWFRMEPRCSSCNLKYERDPGYFLGSTYVNYGFTALTITISYVFFHFRLGYSNQSLTPWLVGFVIVFPLVFFRFARALWLAGDICLDVPNEHADV